jgi:hypothetical protein
VPSSSVSFCVRTRFWSRSVQLVVRAQDAEGFVLTAA